MASRYNRKKDGNHNEIASALEKAGCAVTDMSGAGDGFTDLFVTRAGQHYLIEIKTPTGTLTPAQIAFHAKHQPVYTVQTIEQALQVVGLQ